MERKRDGENKKTQGSGKHGLTLTMRLRLRYTAISLIIVALLLALTCAVIITLLQLSFEHDSDSAIARVLLEELNRPDLPPQPTAQPDNEQRHDDRNSAQTGLPSFIYDVSPDGEVSLERGDASYFNNDDTSDDLVQQALRAEKADGYLESDTYRYARSNVNGNTRVAIVDLSSQRNAMDKVLEYSLLISSCVLVVFLVICYLLSGFFVRPIVATIESQRRFVADASHELKTPLTVILSGTEMMLAEPSLLDESHVEMLHDEAGRMKELTEQLLRLAWVDSQGRANIKEDVDFSDLVQSLLMNCEPVAYEQGVELTEDVEPNLHLMGVATPLRQMVATLMDNAFKYTPRGKTVTVTLKRVRRKLFLSVHNTGSVIEADKLPHLFERFYRADPSRTEVESFGLGLSIAQGIAVAHNGSISVESSEANGTTFLVMLPILEPQERIKRTGLFSKIKK